MPDMQDKKNPALHPTNPRKVFGAQQDHETQLAEYADIRQQVLAFRDYIVANHPEEGKLIDQLETCGSWLFFRWFYRVDIHRLAGGFTCKKHLFCTCCAVRRAAVYAKSYEQAVRHVLAENPHLVPVLITYTVKNGPDLAERLAHLKKAQRTLLNYRRQVLSSKSTACVDTILRHVHGGAGSYEVKIGSGSGEWHVHIHEIALLDSREFTFTEQLLPVRKKHPNDIQRWKRVYVPEEFKAALRAEWKNITGDSDQVDVRGLHPREQYSRLQALPEQDAALSFVLPDQEGPDAPDSIFSGVCEAFKYALKTDGGMTHEQHFHAAKLLSGSRLIYSYGSLRNVQVPDESADEIEAALVDEPYLEKVYRYHQGAYVFDRINEGDEIIFPLGSAPRFKKKSKKRTISADQNSKHFTPDQVKDWVEQYQARLAFSLEPQSKFCSLRIAAFHFKFRRYKDNSSWSARRLDEAYQIYLSCVERNKFYSLVLKNSFQASVKKSGFTLWLEEHKRQLDQGGEEPF